MKSLRTVALGIALLALITGGAIAQGGTGRGSIKDAPNAAPTFVWSGLYVGGAVGYGVGGSDLSSSGAGNFLDINLTGEQWIATVGYDFQLSPRWVLGLFADYAFGEVTGIAPLRVSIDDQWAIGSRVGVLATPATLFYVSAGYTAASFKFVEAGESGFRGSLDGFLVGLGVQQAFTRNLSLKLDYRFSHYGDDDVRVGVNNFDNETHSARLGVNYHFGNTGLNRHSAHP